MRSRGLLIVGLVLAVLVGGSLAAWPMLTGYAARTVEDRLTRETGLRWRVGSLGIEMAPALVLNDLTAEGDGPDGPRASVRRVRVTGPFGLAMGQPGTAQAAVEGLSLRMPALSGAAPARGGARTGGGERPPLSPSAVRAVIRGADLALADGNRTVTAAAEAVDLTLDLVTGNAAPAIRIELADLGTLVEADPPAGSLRDVRLTVRGRGPRVNASASASAESDALRLERVTGSIDGAPFTGSLSVERTARPRIALDLRLDALTLTGEDSGPARADPVRGFTVPVRADIVPDVAWFRLFDGQGALSVKRLTMGALQFQGVDLAARVQGGALEATLANASAYDGTARGRYGLRPDGGTGRHQLSLSLARVRVLPLMQDVAGVRGLDGTGTVKVEVQSRGATPNELLRGATGTIEMSAADGRIDGLDLARAAGLIGGSAGLATRLDLLGGTFSLADGQAVSNDLRMKTALVDAQGICSLDLIGRTIDLRLKPLKVTAGAGGRLNVPIQIQGPWSNPSVKADLAGLAQDPGSTLQGLQELGNGILGENGGGLGGLGGLLDGLMQRPGREPPPRRRP